MITLLTGVPGSGKTAALVDLLSRIAKDRPLYSFGLEGLKLSHEKLEPAKWHELVPDGSICVIDEVQDVWRARGPGTKPTPDIMALEVHRHRGIDFYLTSQKPRLLDSNVRDLVGRHIHLREMGMLGRWWYEWPECSEKVSWRTAPIKKRYKLPKAAFELYTSASQHIKPIRSIPWIVAVFLVALLAVAGGAWYAIRSISAKVAPLAPADQKSVTAKLSGGTQGSTVSSSSGGGSPVARWPVYDAVPVRADREPFAGRAIQYEGGYSIGPKTYAVFGIMVDGQRATTITLPQLLTMGYQWIEQGPCVGILRYKAWERLVTCPKAAPVREQERETQNHVQPAKEAV